MKKIIFLLSLLASAFSLQACGDDNTDGNDSSVPPIVNPGVQCFKVGTDFSWATEMAADGKQFYNVKGEAKSCPEVMNELGMTVARFRVWVNPQNKGVGFCDAADALAKAKAAKAAGIEHIMIDFHFSDWWADPGRQDTPADWAEMSFAELKTAVATHVTDVLQQLAAADIPVSYIQIGNETRNGMLHPIGQLWNDNGDLPNGWKQFTELYMAGYNAAKAVYPTAKVGPHLNHAYEDNAWWFNKLKANGGKMDLICLSHYPQADDNSQSWQSLNTLATTRIQQLYNSFGTPVMIAEYGTKAANEATALTIMKDFTERLRNLPIGTVEGILYWEPEVYGNWKPASYNQWKWNAYDQGAFTSAGRPAQTMQEFYKCSLK